MAVAHTYKKQARRAGRAVAAAVVTLALLAAPLPAGPRTARAAEIGSVRFSDRVEMAGYGLHLRGVGRVRYMRIWEVYVGGLYLAPDTRADQVLADVPKRLEFRYSRKVRADQLTEAADAFLVRNLDADLLERFRPEIEAINRLYRDVDVGDRYALTYVPGRGTQLELNGDTLGVIEGAEFAAAYYSIWLGADPISRDFRDDLLGPT